MAPELKDCIGFAADLAKQLLTLSTGVVALMATYANGSGQTTSRTVRRAFLAAATSFMVSIVAGLGTLMALVGQLASATDTKDCGVLYEPGVLLLGRIQVLLFLLGIGLTLRFGMKLLRTAEVQSNVPPPPREPHPPESPPS